MCVTRIRTIIAICFVCAALNIKTVHPSQDLIKEMMVTFTKTLNFCIKEMSLPKDIVKDFINFWKPDHEVTDINFGCAVICMATKINLLDEYGNVHHGNTHDYIVGHGADSDKAKQLVALFVECEKTFADISEDCFRTLQSAKCFKAKVHDLDWAPSIEMVMAEMLADI